MFAYQEILVCYAPEKTGDTGTIIDMFLPKRRQLQRDQESCSLYQKDEESLPYLQSGVNGNFGVLYQDSKSD